MNGLVPELTAPRPADKAVWTVSNLLSALRGGLAFVVFSLLGGLPETRNAVLLLIVLAYLSDLADGYLARKNRAMTDLGRIIDPLADKIFVTLTALGLVWHGSLPAWFAGCAIARDVLIFGAGAVMKARTGAVMPSTMTGKVAVVSVGLVLVTTLFRREFGDTAYGFLVGGSLVLMVASLVVYSRRALALLALRAGRAPGAQRAD